MTLQHSSLQHSNVHEPKHISINGTGQSGQVITNSSSTAGQSEYRRLNMSDINNVDELITGLEIDSTTTQTHYFEMPFAGTVQSWRVIVNNALATGSNTHELRINNTQVTGTPITIASGGAAGDSGSATATGANTFSAGDELTVVGTTISNTDTSVDTRYIITVRRA